MLRYLDKILWTPTVYLFFFLKTFFRKKRSIDEISKIAPKKILLIKLRWIWSIILMSPVVTNLKKMYPNAKIHFLTKKGLHKIYGEETFDKTYHLNTGWLINAIKDFIMVPYNLKKEHYDLILDFEVVSYYTAALTFLLSPKYSIWYQIIWKIKDKLYDYNAIYHESKHIMEIFSLPLRILGSKEVDMSLLPPMIAQTSEDSVLSRISDLKEYIAININASDLAYERRWPAKYYKEVIERLQSHWHKILLTGQKEDMPYVDSLYQQIENKDNVLNTAGRFSLSDFFFLVKNVKLFITNDSGPLHMAIAYQTPTISFFGPETPVIYWPNYKKELHKVFFLNLFCSPCISVFRDKNFVCKNENRCMFEIYPEKVISTLEHFFKEGKF